jgi:hypothetical protein
MKNTLKLLFSISLINLISCRPSPTPPSPLPDINIQCQRMSSCYTSNSNLITNPFVVDLVKKAQQSNNPEQCATAVSEIEKSAKVQCPF